MGSDPGDGYGGIGDRVCPAEKHRVSGKLALRHTKPLGRTAMERRRREL
jgi:hypothetical protein